MSSRGQVRPFGETRFRVPLPSDRFIHRPRIAGLLDEHMARPVTLVTGPAGTGKTLAVADWTMEGSPPGPVAWLSLDRGDASVSRFWVSVLSAVAAAVPAALKGVQIPDTPDSSLLHAIAMNAGGALVLVLDDVQELDGGSTIEWLEQVLRWPPEGVRFVLVSRHDPPVALQRLRLEGKVGDVRVADLAFTRAESQELLEDSGISLTASALDRLLGTTSGWAAALRLAALTLRVADDPSEAIDRFGGLSFLVSEYLWDEVFNLLPPEYSEFLLKTSVAGRLCAPLAVALTDEPRADEMLRTLAREQLLAHEVEGTGWYRTHSLLTGVLRARLKASRPELKEELQRKAALWFEENGAWVEALSHAVSSRDWDFAGMIAMRSGAVALLSTDRQPVVELISRIPSAAAADSPELTISLAMSAFARNDGRALALLAEQAEGRLDSLTEPRRSVATLSLRAIQASQAHRDGDAFGMQHAAADAHRLLSGMTAAQSPGWADHRGFTIALRGVAELWAGRPDVACDLLTAVVAAHPSQAFSAFGEVYYRGLLALALSGNGHLTLARDNAERALEIARRMGRSRSYESQWAWLAQSVSLLYAGALQGAAEARRHCLEAAGSRLNPFVATTLHILDARHWLAAGDVGAARRSMALAEADLARRPGMVLPLILLTSLRVDQALAEGDQERARAALAAYDDAEIAHAGHPLPRPDAVSNCRARFLLATGRPELVRPTVEHLLGVVGAEAVQAWLSVAAAEDRLRHDSLAIEAVAKALDLAESEGAELFILRQSRQLATVLRHHQEVVGTHRSLVAQALATVSGPAEPPRKRALTPLTEREQAVLAYLPTMGSNAEIAAALSVSENTVKQHLKSIYRKLTVNSRREAVRVARDAGLLDGLTRITT